MSDFSKAFGSFGSFLGNTAYSGASSGIGNFLNNAIGQLFQGISAKRQWEYQKKAMELQQNYNLENMQRQYDYQLDFWNKNNQYNNPSNAVARWRTAGISPMAVFGSGSGGVGVSGGSVSAPSSDNPSASGFFGAGGAMPGMSLADASQMRNQQRMTDANVDLLSAEARLKRSQAADQEWKNTLQPQYERQLEALIGIAESDKAKRAIEVAWLSFQNAMQMALSSADLDLKKKGLSKYAAEIDELVSRKVLNEEEANRAKEAARNLAALTQTENEARPYKIDSIIRENARKTSETALNWYKTRILGPSDKNRIDADTEEAKARARKVDAEIERLGKENHYTDAQIEYLKHLRKIGWSKFAVSTAKTVSEEARAWISLFKNKDFMSSAGSFIGDEDALGAIAATL